MPSLTTPKVLQFFTAISIAGSFPLQVFFGSPLPSLLPYVLLSVAFASRILLSQVREPIRGDNSGADALILVYVLLILLHMLFHVVDAVIINLHGLLANAVNFLLPVGFYLYFRYFGLGDLRALMWGVLVASLVIGGGSAYHSYNKMEGFGRSILDSYKKNGSLEVPAKDSQSMECVTKPIVDSTLYNQLNQYQWEAAEYSMVRSNQNESSLCRSMRLSGSRSPGLLENHAVNSAWIGLGALAALVVIPCSYGLTRIAMVLSFGGLVFVMQYLTGILAFCLVALMISIRSFRITPLSWRSIRLAAIYSGVSLLALFLVLMLKTEVVTALNALMTERLDMLLHTFWQTLFVGKFQDWAAWVRHFPTGLFVGDGFGIYYSYSFKKGGDIGLFETLAKIGLPFFVVITIWVSSRFRGAWRMGKNTPASNGMNDGFYFACLIMLLAINELHYSIWDSKAVLPLLFASVAALDRLSSNLPEDGEVAG